jgi:hypothetical protein
MMRGQHNFMIVNIVVQWSRISVEVLTVAYPSKHISPIYVNCSLYRILFMYCTLRKSSYASAV